MLFYPSNNLKIYFGDAQHAISLAQIAEQQNAQQLQTIADLLGVSQVALLHQTHGVQGLLVPIDDAHNYFFNLDGDYLMTQRKNCALGVVTADCLPIVLHDTITQSIAIIHAGWKGLLAGIVTITINDMVQRLNVQPCNLTMYLGPAARPCCYEVQQDFIDQFAQKYTFDANKSVEIFSKKNDKIYFDSRLFVADIARNLGIKNENIYTRYNVCTLCHTSFCSYRREKDKALRQITMVCLH